jgi:hypothetical protein
MYKFNWFEKNFSRFKRKAIGLLVQMTDKKHKRTCSNHYTFGANCYYLWQNEGCKLFIAVFLTFINYHCISQKKTGFTSQLKINCTVTHV